MLTSFRGRLAVSLAALACGISTPALAQTVMPAEEVEDDGTDTGAFTISANASVTTDYRFRGVSLSAGDPAIQGGVDVAHDSGFYVGMWASSIEGGPAYGELEFDVYGGWSGQLTDAVSMDVGLLYYAYPSNDLDVDVDYWEPYASVGFNLGPAEATVGAAYAFEQDSLGGDDNLYIYTDLSTGLPGTPLTLSGHLGYTDGVLAPPLLAGDTDDSGLDWSIGASMSASILEVGIAYVGVEGPSIDGFTDDTIVATVTASF